MSRVVLRRAAFALHAKVAGLYPSGEGPGLWSRPSGNDPSRESRSAAAALAATAEGSGYGFAQARVLETLPAQGSPQAAITSLPSAFALLRGQPLASGKGEASRWSAILAGFPNLPSLRSVQAG